MLPLPCHFNHYPHMNQPLQSSREPDLYDLDLEVKENFPLNHEQTLGSHECSAGPRCHTRACQSQHTCACTTNCQGTQHCN